MILETYICRIDIGNENVQRGSEFSTCMLPAHRVRRGSLWKVRISTLGPAVTAALKSLLTFY